MEDISAAPLWIVAVSIDAHVTLPEGGVVVRDDFLAWIWERADGLLGIDEGSVTAADAAARGLVPSWLVIDAAAAPADRDWISGLAVAEIEWCFPDEASARRAADLVADVTGCRLRGIRAEATVDHEELARAAFPPIAVAGFGTVMPAWEAGAAGIAADGEALIFIEPGLGFGTGLHATTQLCMAALAERWRRGGRFDRVLDFGSGSGILGIAAAVLGAARVDAVEIDSGVHDALRTNAGRNGVANRLRLAAGLSSATGPYDVVVANIVSPVLLEHAAELCARLARPGAELILSGVLAAEAPAVADCYVARLAVRPHIQEREGWCCLSFRPG